MERQLIKIYEELIWLRSAFGSIDKRLKRSEEKHKKSIKERRELRAKIVELRLANESVYNQNFKLVQEKQKCQQKLKMK